MAVAGYNFYENGVKLNTSLLPTPSYTRTGLGEGVSGTCYFTAVDDATPANESGPGDVGNFTTLVTQVPNLAPTAHAGSDQTATAGSTVTLLGSATDTDGEIVTHLWEQTVGPNTATLTGGNTASASVSNLVAGTYTFRLTVTDNSGASASDTVVLTVKAAGVPVPASGNLSISPQTGAIGQTLQVSGAWNINPGTETTITGRTIYKDGEVWQQPASGNSGTFTFTATQSTTFQFGFTSESGEKLSAVQEIDFGVNPGRFGPYVKSFSSSGSSPGLVFPYMQGLNPATAPHTIEFWVRARNDGARQIMASTASGTNQRCYIGFTLHTNGARYWNFGFGQTAWQASDITGATITDMKWTHVALVMSGTTAALYIDHVLAKQISYTSFTFANNLMFGSSYGVDVAGMDYDGVKVWNKALTAQERQDSANVSHYSPQPNLQLNANFDDYTYNDLSGNNRHGIPTAIEIKG